MTIGIGGTGRLSSILGRIALVLVVAGGLACRQKAPAPAGPDATKKPAAAEPNTAPATAEANKPAVTVNGQVVTEKEVNDRIAAAMKSYARQMANLPPQYAEQMQKQIKTQLLDRLVMERLLEEQVKAGHFEATEQDATAEIEKAAARQQPPMTVAEFQTRVESLGGNFQDIKDEFRRQVGYRRVFEAQWAGKVDVTEEQAKKYYDDNAKQFEVPEQVRASHILVALKPTDPNRMKELTKAAGSDSDPNKIKAAAKEKATKILEQVKAGGDFAALAKENSDCPSAPKGGDLGFFAREQMVKEFADAAWVLQNGQVSDIVETEYGFHIIKRTDHNDASKTPFDKVKAAIVDDLTDEKKNTLAQEYLDSLKSKAKIVYAAGYEPQAPEPAPRPVQPAPQPTQPTSQAPAQAAPQPAPQPAQPTAQPAPTTGATEPNATKSAPR